MIKNTPIHLWKKLISEENNIKNIENELKNIYAKKTPETGELIFTPYCALQCEHCIYPIDYSIHNLTISFNEWIKIIEKLYSLGIRIFISGGRSIDKNSLEVFKWCRSNYPDVKIGIIDNGLSICSFIEDLKLIKPDWIDISIDGMQKEHETMRKKEGSFNQTLNSTIFLKEKLVSSKINILSCVTNINKNSIAPMIEFLNQRGFQNFFITPVTTFMDYGPSNDLRLNGEDFLEFINSIKSSMKKFDDTWIELNIFELNYMQELTKSDPGFTQGFIENNECLTLDYHYKNNDFFIHYHPLSLNGLFEMIINCNGDLIMPVAMRKSKIDNEDITGNFVSEEALVIIENKKNNIDFFIKELLKEKEILKKSFHKEKKE